MFGRRAVYFMLSRCQLCFRCFRERWPVVSASRGVGGQAGGQLVDQAVKDVGKPAEKVSEGLSMATGLFCNKIDLNMMIFPEFQEADDVDDIEVFASRVRKVFTEKVDVAEMDQQRRIPDDVLYAFKKLGLYGMNVPKEQGGLSLNNKEKTRIYAELGADWSLFLSTFVHNELVTMAIKMFGSEEQKQRYLPKLATGEMTGAFCLHESTCGQDVAGIECRATPFQQDGQEYLFLNGLKSWVTNGALADVLIVFSKIRKELDELDEASSRLSALLVDRKDSSGVSVVQRHNTLGLRALEVCDLKFEAVKIPIHNAVLGLQNEGFNVAMQTMNASRHLFAAAAAHVLKRLIAAAAKHCNEKKRYGIALCESDFIRNRLSTTALNIYALETMAFYIAGYLDEQPSRDFTVEASMAMLYARRALRDGVVSFMDIFGASATSTNLELERVLRDVTTLSAFLNTDDWLVGQISLAGVVAWAKDQSIDLHKILRPAQFPFYAYTRRWLQKDLYRDSYRFKHYIYEKVHPSLENACRFIEEVMAKFEYTLRQQLQCKGKEIEKDAFAQLRLCDVATSLFVMLTCVSRASRSYSIGLRDGDLEITMAHSLCANLKVQMQHRMMDMLKGKFDVYGLHGEDLMNLKVGSAILQNNGYSVHSPIEKNCDPAMKQFLLYLDETRALGSSFIIKDLDELHLFLSADILPTLKEKIDALMESLSPDLAEK